MAFYLSQKTSKGKRDPQIIDLLIKSNGDYSNLRGYDNKKRPGKKHCRKQTWLYIIEQANSGSLNDWIKMERVLIQTFKHDSFAICSWS